MTTVKKVTKTTPKAKAQSQNATEETQTKPSKDQVILSEQEAIAKYNSLKQDIKERTDVILKAVVKDDASYGIMKENATHLNKIITNIDKRRKEVNAPAQKFIDFNNAMAKAITAEAQNAIPLAKQKLLDYDKVKDEEDRKRQEKVEEENRKRQELLDRETARKNKELESIKQLVIDAQKAINEAVDIGVREETLKALKQCKADYYTKPLENIQPDHEFYDEYMQALETIKEMGRTATINAKAEDFEKVEADESIMEALDETREAIQEDANEKTVEILASDMTSSLVTHNKASYREGWTFEVIDKSKVPDALKEVNPVAVNAWIKNLKVSESPDLVDGKIINGIKLIRTETAILR